MGSQGMGDPSGLLASIPQGLQGLPPQLAAQLLQVGLLTFLKFLNECVRCLIMKHGFIAYRTGYVFARLADMLRRSGCVVSVSY